MSITRMDFKGSTLKFRELRLRHDGILVEKGFTIKYVAEIITYFYSFRKLKFNLYFKWLRCHVFFILDGQNLVGFVFSPERLTSSPQIYSANLPLRGLILRVFRELHIECCYESKKMGIFS